MRLSFTRRHAGVLLSCMLLFHFGSAGCKRTGDSSNLGTFHMGDTVVAGPLTYQVIEARWSPEIPSVPRRPNDRYLLVRVDITNTSSKAIAVPGFTLHSSAGKAYNEVTEGLADAPNWLGMLRSLEPKQKLAGYAFFDAPIGAYKLAVSDAGEVGSEKYAHIDIPADLG